MDMEIEGKKITLTPLKGRVVKKAMKLMFKIMKQESEEDQALIAEEYLDYIDEQSAEMAGMTIDELDDLPIDEKKKITSIIGEKIESSLDFMKSSPQPANSSNKNTTR